ncbi:uncharacterized protein LOC143367740 isoform X2 [Andrena cerasifolii]|uniref:uncharacterized protein LOC143367740 isoform X2 n=1 Tax=Andrena cerasifolii TaxID=2819439 RepID=UPI004037EE46
MNNAPNYPSCIKIPSTNSKQTMASTMFPQKFDIKEALSLNSELISLANRIFGEEKWSHSITNQTVDFVEAFMGKYVCGCTTFVKIQLQDGPFHEDMGYCYAEGAVKGLSIQYARAGSLTEAFKKVLSCFGETMQTEVQKLCQKLPNSRANNIQREDSQFFLSNIEADILEPCAQSTPFVICKNGEKKDEPENVCYPKSAHNGGEQQSALRAKLKSSSGKDLPTEQKMHCIPSKSSNDTKAQLQSNATNPQKEPENARKGQDQKKVPEEEFLRMERKRKQMEKQAEYKRLMIEKGQQKSVECKKPYPKY